jgi:Fe-S oxidoreductase containing radical SAM domain
LSNHQGKIGTGRDENRTELYRVVPLAVPFSIGLNLCDYCNFKCVYCWHSVGGFKHPHMMSYDAYQEIADQIEELYCANENQHTKNIRLCGYGEPLMNRDAARIIRDIRARELSDRIELTTNGSLLTHELSDALIASGLTRLLISVQGVTAEKYKEVCGYTVDYAKFLEEIAYFYAHRGSCKLYIKTVDVALDGAEDEALFYDMFGGICDEMNIEHIIDVADCVDYSELLPDGATMRYAYEFKEKKVCDSLFTMVNIEAAGHVNCCACRYPPLPIGSVHTSRLKDIWNGTQHIKYMKLHLEGRIGEIPHCADCTPMQYAGHPMDNLDDHREEVLARVQKLPY